MTGLASDVLAYRRWVAVHDTPDLAALNALPKLDGPLVSVLMTAGDTTAEGAVRSAESLIRQVYENWELLVAYHCRAAWPRAVLEACAAADPRIRLVAPAGEGRLMAAVARAHEGALLCVVEAGDVFAPSALHEVVAAFAASPQIELVYSDEDIWEAGGRRDPRFKPDFSGDAFLAGNAIGQLAVYRRALFEAAGGVNLDADPNLGYDLALRALRQRDATRVKHLPAVLLHRAGQPPDWPAQADDPPRGGAQVGVVETTFWPRIVYDLGAPPLVTIIIPMRDRADLLRVCVAGILERTDYPRIEVLIVDNGSTEAEALAFLRELETRGRARVLRCPGAFNFAALNNAAAAVAGGEILLLLNNDIEIIRPDWLTEMVSHAVRPDVGAVGALLLYPNDTVQHAGLLLGPAGAATHVGRHARRHDGGYDGQLACTRDLSAVTGACLAIRRAVFEEVGGMEERLAVAWNDVDLCLRVRKAGKRVVWTPHAVLRHHESATRGLESEDAAKLQRFRDEQALMMRLWGDALDVDPFLNPNLLAADNGSMVLARPRRRRPWERHSID